MPDARAEVAIEGRRCSCSPADQTAGLVVDGSAELNLRPIHGTCVSMARLGLLVVAILAASTSCQDCRESEPSVAATDGSLRASLDGSSTMSTDTGGATGSPRDDGSTVDARNAIAREDSNDGGSPALDEPRDDPREISQKALDAADVNAVIQGTKGERHWKTKVDAPTQEFVKAISGSFDSWGKVLIQLSAADQRSEADEICEAIVELRDHLGAKLLPVERYDSFIRDRFWVEPYRVETAQFFEPVRYHPTDDRILKLIRLSAYREGQVVRRYYLEKSSFTAPPTYSLGRADDDTREHQVVENYGAARPSYWQVKARVIVDLDGREDESDVGSSGTPSNTSER